MEIIRNLIKISGISQENDLPKNMNGQVIQYTDHETISIPEESPEIQGLFHIMIELDVKSSRQIRTPVGTTIVLEGMKRYKILYSSKSDRNNAFYLDYDMPYYTFFELPKGVTMENVRVYIMDAYFKVMGSRSIYCQTLYYVYVSVNLNKLENLLIQAKEKDRIFGSSES